MSNNYNNNQPKEEDQDSDDQDDLQEAEDEYDGLEEMSNTVQPKLDIFRKLSIQAKEKDFIKFHPAKKRFLQDFNKFVEKKVEEKQSTAGQKNQIDQLLKVEESLTPKDEKQSKYSRIQFELRRKLKTQGKTKETRFNEIFKVFKQLDTFVDIKPFLHDLNTVNNARFYETIQELKTKIAEKQSQRDLDEILDEVKDRIGNDEQTQGNSDIPLYKSMQQFLQEQKLLQQSSEHVLEWKKKNHYNLGLMSHQLIEHFSTPDQAFKSLMDANDPEIDSQQFYDLLNKQLFQKKGQTESIEENHLKENNEEEEESFNEDYKEITNSMRSIQHAPKRGKQEDQEIELTEEQKLEKAHQEISSKLLTADDFEKDNVNFSDNNYFLDFQQKAEKVRLNLKKVTESLFKQKWANANIKMKRTREEEYHKVMKSLAKANNQEFDRIYFPSKDSFKNLFKGKEVSSKVQSLINTPSHMNGGKQKQNQQQQTLNSFSDSLKKQNNHNYSHPSNKRLTQPSFFALSQPKDMTMTARGEGGIQPYPPLSTKSVLQSSSTNTMHSLANKSAAQLQLPASPQD